MTAPLVPPHVNLRGFKYMPLDVVRLRDSDFAAHADGEAFRCAVLLWCAAWHQVPAGSLPDDDKVLAGFVGMSRSPRLWKKTRGEVLKNFVKCSDGRFHHPVIAEKALEAWQAHLKERFKNEMGRLKKAMERADIKGIYPTFDEWKNRYEETGNPLWPIVPVPTTDAICPGDVPTTDPSCPGDVPSDTASKGREGKGRDTVSIDSSKRADTSKRAEALARALRECGFEQCSATAPDILQMAAQQVSESELRDAAKGHSAKPLAWIASRVFNRRKDAAGRVAGSAPHLPAPADTNAAAERQWRWGIEAEILDVQQRCDRLGLIAPERRDAEVQRLRSVLAAGWQGAREVPA